MPTPRVYDANARRLLQRSTIVYTLLDIQRAMQLARNEGRPCDLELGANIFVERAFDIPSALVSFSLDGAGRFNIYVSGTITTLFGCKASPTLFSNVGIVLKAGAAVTTAFLVSGSPTILANVVVDATAGTLTNIFDLVTAGSVGKLIVDTADFRNISHIFKAPNDTAQWRNSRISDLTVTGVGAAAVSLGQGSTSPGFAFCRFERITGPIAINPGPAGSDAIFDQVQGDGVVSTIDTTNNANANVFIDCAGFVTMSLTRLDTVVGGRGGVAAATPARLTGLSTPSSSTTLSTAGPTITPGASSFVRVTHAAGSSGNVTVAAGIDGQRLTLSFVSYAGTAVYRSGFGNLRIAASPFTPAAKNVMELIYDATSGEWQEQTRSLNA